MSEFLLKSLEIKGYRCFEHLTIEKLGRVNLIVGKNNVGKTALLEALWLYANGAYSHLFFEILKERNEIPPSQEGLLAQPESNWGLRNLFFNRPSLNYIAEDYPDNFDDELMFQIGQSKEILGREPKPSDKVLQVKGVRPNSNANDDSPSTRTSPNPSKRIENYFIKANGLTDKKLVEFWDNIERLVMEDSVIKALKIITPDLIDIRFSGYPNGSFSRIPVVRLEGAKERVPLRSLGDGMTRLLGIAAAMINCKDGMFIIDEIESGLHFSVLPDVWKLIFKTAKDLNVQVFATTHSDDCVEAFAAAAEESPEDGMLIRLERQGERIIAKTIEENRLELAMEHGVEVR